MEDIIQVITNNGLGVASFFVLIYFMFHYVEKINDTMGKMCDILNSIQKNLLELTTRVERLEKTKKKEEKHDNN